MRGTLPGFRDFYPEDFALRLHIVDAFRMVMGRFAFDEYDGPVLEPLELFTDKSGPEIVGQLFHFKDRGDRDVAMRPEMTPTLARMVGARCQALRKPIRWCAVGEQFRYERPQKGRLRSFLQLNCDILGESGFRADGELIAALLSTLQELGFTANDICLRLSDRQLWTILLSEFPLCDGEAILRAIDRSGKEPAEVTEAVLRSILGDFTDRFIDAWRGLVACNSLDSLREFFSAFPSHSSSERIDALDGLLKFLGAMGFGDFISVDLSIVRGLAYYTGFVFEVFERSGAGRAVAGGGRYDGLVEKLGGPPLAACGFAIGDVVLSNLLVEKKLFNQSDVAPDLWVIFDDERQAEALEMANVARRAGARVAYELRESVAEDKQLKQATRAGARFVLARCECGDRWRIKNLSSGEAVECSRCDFLTIWLAICENDEICLANVK
ncbi:MAG: histidine--tRNA ligase [Puniceicoccales bacterium]|jgi:histidyl-tRNA synthetase|nr:histidine--tRNA ligase [Puniceicoccales bacterium]